jgi:hypothetical protein
MPVSHLGKHDIVLVSRLHLPTQERCAAPA